MIETLNGDLLGADTQALVNTVNCVGVMGKGIALQFKRAFPPNTVAYEEACKAGELAPGRVLVVQIEDTARDEPRFIINFPTKDNWKGKSKIEWIRAGLQNLVEEVRARKIQSIAIPPLGCGNGGLKWDDVFPLIESAFLELPDVHVLVFLPTGAPDAGEQRHLEAPPKMSLANALYVHLIENYRAVERAFSQLEIQKLAYFLQEAGQPLKLAFSPDKYGPYAPQLRQVLNKWEGHYMTGYGDGTGGARKTMTLEDSVLNEAQNFLRGNSNPAIESRLNRVAELVEGFDNPYSLELLATVHWVATRNNLLSSDDLQEIIEGVQNWSDYKRATFSQQHVEVAWQHLREHNWLPNNPAI